MSDWTQTDLEVGRRLRWVRAPKAQHSLRYVRQSAPSQRSAAWCSGVFRKSRFVLTSWKRWQKGFWPAMVFLKGETEARRLVYVA